MLLTLKLRKYIFPTGHQSKNAQQTPAAIQFSWKQQPLSQNDEQHFRCTACSKFQSAHLTPRVEKHRSIYWRPLNSSISREKRS
jgi:hypothetical protein